MEDKEKNIENDKSTIFEISAKNRLVLMTVLPKEKTYVAMRLLLNLREKLELTKKELEDYKIVIYPNGSISFTNKELANTTKEIRIDNIVVGIIKEEFKKLDKEQKITTDLIELYELFIL